MGSPNTMKPDAPVDDNLLALIRNDLGDAAQGCASELRAQGVQGIDDWSILETAGEHHILDVLSAVAAKHSLNADVWVGTMTGDNKSKQTALIRSLRKGRGRDIDKDVVLTRLP